MDITRIGSLQSLAVLAAIRNLGGSATCGEIMARLAMLEMPAFNGLADGKGRYGSLHMRLRKALKNELLTRTMNTDATRGRPNYSHVYHLSDGAYLLLSQWDALWSGLQGVHNDRAQTQPVEGQGPTSDEAGEMDHQDPNTEHAQLSVDHRAAIVF